MLDYHFTRIFLIRTFNEDFHSFYYFYGLRLWNVLSKFLKALAFSKSCVYNYCSCKKKEKKNCIQQKVTNESITIQSRWIIWTFWKKKGITISIEENSKTNTKRLRKILTWPRERESNLTLQRMITCGKKSFIIVTVFDVLKMEGSTSSLGKDTKYTA